jgi:hypothetical protein
VADNIVIAWFSYGGGLYEANLLSGTYYHLETPAHVNGRKALLTRAGIPAKDYGAVADPKFYGQEVLSGAELVAAIQKMIVALPAWGALTNQVKADQAATAAAAKAVTGVGTTATATKGAVDTLAKDTKAAAASIGTKIDALAADTTTPPPAGSGT